MIKVISFDFDGTITKTTFADLFWLEGLPKLYSEKYNVDLEEAKNFLFREYDKIGKERLEWYDPDYWFNRFNINYSWKKLMEDYSYAIEIYADVIPTLERLKNSYDFIIISNARREFIEIQMEKLNIKRYFKRVFSTVSDFNMVKKGGEVYRKVCEQMGIDKSELIHVGDDYRFDFLAPRSIGVKAIYLDRKSGKNGDFVISSLEYLPNLINRF